MNEQKNSVYNKLQFIFIVLGMYLVGYVVTIVGIIFPFISSSFNVNIEKIQFSSTYLIIGIAIGAFFLGNIIEKIGVKKVALFDIFLILFFNTILLIHYNQYFLYIGMLFIGIGLGGEYSVTGALIRLFFSNRKENTLHHITIMFQAIGSFIGAIVAFLILFKYPKLIDWKYFLLTISFFSFIIFIGRYFFIYRAKDAIEPKNNNNSEVSKSALHFIFQKKHFKNLILSSIPWFFMDFSVYGVNIFTPTILQHLDFKIPFQVGHIENILIQKEISILGGTSFIDLFLVVGFLIGIFLTKKIKLISLQIMGFLMMALFFTFLIIGESHHQIIIMIIGFLSFNLFLNMGPNLTTFSVAQHVFKPQDITTAQGISAGIGKIGAITSTLIFPILIQNYGINSVFLVVVFVSLAGAFVSYFYRRLIHS